MLLLAPSPASSKFAVSRIRSPSNCTLNSSPKPPSTLMAMAFIKLKDDYGIEAPSQFGVKMLNEVKFHIDFKTTAEAK